MEIKNLWKQWIRKERYFLISAGILGFFITLLIGYRTKGYSDVVQSGLSNHLIRFHVIANSDAPEDQALKIK